MAMEFGKDCIMLRTLESGIDQKLKAMEFMYGRMEIDTRESGMSA
jgi:hypothetical protein